MAIELAQEPLSEIMGERDAARYREAAEAAVLYGRTVKDMDRDDLLLVIGFLIEDWPSVPQFTARSRTPAA